MVGSGASSLVEIVEIMQYHVAYYHVHALSNINNIIHIFNFTST